MNVVSFDVFDTLLTRFVGAPTSAFLFACRRVPALQRHGLTPQSFAALRIHAETCAASRTVSGEPSLRDIYDEVAFRLGCTEAETEELIAAEIELAHETVTALPGAADRVAAARATTDRVAFLSDMYLPESEIRAMLIRFGLYSEGDILLVSSAAGRSKRKGDLFLLLCTTLGVRPDQVHHVGDHPVNDVTRPSSLGLRAVLCDDAGLNRYERILEEASAVSSGLSSLLSGASRLARLSTRANTDHDRAIRDVGAGVAGPIIVCFVAWVLREAHRSHVKRLFFVARDGQILKAVADRLNQQFRFDLDIRYLYGSREAWYPAALAGGGELRRQILQQEPGIPAWSIERALKRRGLVPATAAAFLDAHGLSTVPTGTTLSGSAADRFNALLAEPAFERLVAERASAAREIIDAYLRQAGYFDDVETGIVDIGWAGRVLGVASQMRLDAGLRPAEAFFLGLTHDPPSIPESNRHTYLLQLGARARGEPFLPYMSVPIEMFCSATHGRTLGYRQRSDGTAEPIFDDRHVQATQAWGVPLLQAAIGAFTERLELKLALPLFEHDLREAVGALLRTFWLEPTRSEVRAWGAYPFEDETFDSGYPHIAIPYGIRSLPGVASCGESGLPRRMWAAGSWAMTPQWTRRALRGAMDARGTAAGRAWRRWR